MSYSIFSSTSPAMPKPTKGTEIVKLLLSQASKDMREPLLPMVMPAFAAHLSDVELMYSDNKYHELCGQMGHLIGPSGIGKDQLLDLAEATMRSFRAHDEIEYKKLENWQHQTLPKRKAVVQTTPNPSSLGFAALLCKELRRGNWHLWEAVSGDGERIGEGFLSPLFWGFVEEIGQLAERAGEWIKLWGRRRVKETVATQEIIHKNVSQLNNKKIMKQMIMTLLAAVMVSTAAGAQDKDSNKPSVDNNRKQEMVKHRTDKMVEDYQLNDKQAKKLLSLNTEYADKMRPHHHGPHGAHGPHGMRGQRPEPPREDMNGERPEPPKGDRLDRWKEMAETMKAYDAELQKIMTAEQYEKYKADMKQRRERDHKGPHRPQ